jgi:Na+-transporting NADH:ubiquinone oxidoreductase subunit NqrB
VPVIEQGRATPVLPVLKACGTHSFRDAVDGKSMAISVYLGSSPAIITTVDPDEP